jgi:hypothetical protein
VIFPGETKVRKEDVRLDISKDVTIPPNASSDAIVIERRRFTTPILITLCADYQSSPETGSRHHQTGYAFNLTQTIPEIDGIAYVDPTRRGTVPAATLGMRPPQFYSSQYAN